MMKKPSFQDPAKARKGEVSTLKEAMQELFKAYRLQDKFDEKQLVASWGRIMGAPIAKRTTSIFINKKKLYVTLNSGPLKQELNYSKHKVLELIWKEFGKEVVEDVVFM
jgi:predicted nucleic acid-binding Zn ribbon protein